MAVALYQASVITGVILTAVYAQEVVGFSTQQLVVLILVVNITSSVGAFVFGFVQDKIGSESRDMDSRRAYCVLC